MEMVLVNIDLVRISSRRQKGISPRRIDEFRRKIEREEDVFPVRLCALGDGTYVVQDGRHRVNAYKAAGYKFILVFVENLTKIRDVLVDVIRRLRRAFSSLIGV